MPHAPRLRPATADDVPRIAAIERASFADPWSTASFRELLAQPHLYFRVVVEPRADEPVGYVVAWFVVPEAEIANVAVAPPFRGRGYGGVLLDGALASAVEAGAREAFLEVRASNDAAQRLYLSRGFSPVGRRRGYYSRPPEDAIVMRAELG